MTISDTTVKNKYIFLDFDGVLNSLRSTVADQKLTHALAAKRSILLSGEIDAGFDTIAVALVYRVATITGAKIVISSSWRYAFTLDELRNMFLGFGWQDANDLIIGVTPKLDSGHRGSEVKMWLDEHAATPYEYVIIDDNSDILEEQREHFVYTDTAEGFLFKDYIKSLECLNYKDISLERYC